MFRPENLEELSIVYTVSENGISWIVKAIKRKCLAIIIYIWE